MDRKRVEADTGQGHLFFITGTSYYVMTCGRVMEKRQPAGMKMGSMDRAACGNRMQRSTPPGLSWRNTRDEPPDNEGIPSTSGRYSPIAHRTRSRTSVLGRPDFQELPIRSRRRRNSDSSRRDRSRSPIDREITQSPPASTPPREEAPQCSICLDDLPEGEGSTSLPCSHQFHQRCISRWLEEHPTCPMCRATVPNQARYRQRREITYTEEGLGEVTVTTTEEGRTEIRISGVLLTQWNL
ncbi:uncharacterized protein [Hyperolius riggenbachi]|uniref:uncharacterized protein n=1 Tax=Hyperolius riggenbachi TaxID=752182 RepID=UPI0035A2BD14